MTRPVRVRFAPSPTGLLHIGSAHTALCNWLYARHYDGRFLLRIEDTDEQRSRPEWVDAIFDSMRWLGMDWDETVIFQSQRLHRYQERVTELLAAGKAYYCYYLPEELEERRLTALQQGISWRNDRRYLGVSEIERRELEADGRKPVVRLMIPDGRTVFQDRILGTISVENETIDDFVIARSDGSPLYHLAVVVDDIDMAISHVIRGMDHVSNTPKHVQLFQALGYDLPEFAHLPNILGADKKKLSKRHGAVSVSEYRESGFLPEAVVNFLALLGWQSGDDQEIFTTDELRKRFSLDQVHKRDTMFDLQKFEWLNGQHLLMKPHEVLVDQVVPFLIKAGLITEEEVAPRRVYLQEIVALLGERCRTLADFAVQSVFFFVDGVVYNPEAVKKNWAKEPDAVTQRLMWLHESLRLLVPFDSEQTERAVRQLAEMHGLKPAQFIHPCRLALTGEMAGPSLFHLIGILGKEPVLARLQSAVNWIEAEKPHWTGP